MYAEENMYDVVTEDYINERIGEQMLADDQWSAVISQVVSVLHS